jgi:hypothetical protein
VSAVKTLGRLFRFILVVAALLVIGYIILRQANKDPLSLFDQYLGADQGTPQAESDLMVVPDGFETQADYTVQPGTEVAGVGMVDDGFTFVGVEKVEFVIGYTIEVPADLGPEGFELDKPEVILDMVLFALKAVGINDSEDMPGIENIGDEAVGVTFTTKWKDNIVRVDAIIFRKGTTGAIAAVGYVDGQQPSVLVMDVATNLDTKIK